MKIAVSLPDEQVDAARRAVAEGRAASVSAFVSAAIQRSQTEHGQQALLEQMDDELGAPTDADRAWADEALGLG